MIYGVWIGITDGYARETRDKVREGGVSRRRDEPFPPICIYGRRITVRYDGNGTSEWKEVQL